MRSARYEITIRGRLSDRLTAAFDALTATPAGADTVLHSGLLDQAALLGVLERVDSLGLELLGVRRTAGAR